MNASNGAGESNFTFSREPVVFEPDNSTFNNDTSASSTTKRNSYYAIPADFMDIFQIVVACGIIPTIAVLGILGNTLSIIVLCRLKKKSSTTICLIVLAFADLAYLLVSIVNCIKLGADSFNKELATLLQFNLIVPFSVYISPLPGRFGNWLIALISLERLVAVTLPFKVRMICTKKTMILQCIGTFIFAAAVSFPKLYLYKVIDYQLPDGNVKQMIVYGSFGQHKEAFKIYYLISETVLRFVPMTILVMSSSYIIAVLCMRAKWRKSVSDTSNKSMKSELQTTRTLMTICVVYIVCLLLTTVSRLMILLDENSSYHTYSTNLYSFLNFIGYILECANSSMNFLIYVATQESFRKGFQEICPCFYKKMRKAPYVLKNDSYVYVSRDTFTSTSTAISENSTCHDTLPNSVGEINEHI